MGKFLGINFGKNDNVLKEEIKAFNDKGKFNRGLKTIENQRGEGWESLSEIPGFSNVQVQGFNLFYNTHINKDIENELHKIRDYRLMAAAPEIQDVIEDAVNESTQEDEMGNVFHLNIIDKEIQNNENIVRNIKKEFELVFRERIQMKEKAWELLFNYYIDGRTYYERVIDTSNPKGGIINIKVLPSETMDYYYDPMSGQIPAFVQYLQPNFKKPANMGEAKKMDGKELIFFDPDQIGFFDYGIYGRTKHEIIGYLDKARIPYNQLKLLETAVIIMRIVRAPQRYVFKIDTGNMPRDKSLKFVEKVAQKMKKKQSYDPSTGNLTNTPDVMCIRKNTKIPLLDGRHLPLIEIIDEFNEGKENWVYSINKETFDIEPGKIVNAKITRKNEKLIRIHLDSGNYIDTTYDHKFILRNGNEVEAQKLNVNDSLMPLYKKNKEMSGTSKLEYEKIFNPGTKKWRWTHRMVVGNVKKGKVRHHIDFNRFNNNPTNIKILGIEEHFKYHQDILIEKWENDHEKQADSIRNGIKKWHENEDNFKRHSEWTTRTNIEQNKIKKCLEVLNTPEMRKKQIEAVRKHKTEYFKNEENRKSLSKKKSMIFDNFILDILGKTLIENCRPSRNSLLQMLSENIEFMSHIKKINENQSFSMVQYNHINKQFLWKIVKHLGYSDYKDFRENYQYNHKIVKIEFLEERDDTGCITVDGNHNFAAGNDDKSLIFIKNSILDNFFLPTSSEGRGSSIDTIGGDTAGMYGDLADVNYFQSKLYRALKYPPSRVHAMQEGRDADSLFGGGSTGNITLDEVKWSRFLERQQNRLCSSLLNTFLLHLEFKGMKKQYELDDKKISITMNPPSHYKMQMEQMFLDSKFANYSQLADREEFSKIYLQRRYLKWSDEEIRDNFNSMKEDIKYGIKREEE
jgi:Bacteriophage T4-like portal protein (Gp20)/Intein splicing domain